MTESTPDFSIDDVIHALEHNLDDRKLSSAKESYVASLYQKGINKILEKIGEEATETILAAKDVRTEDQASRSALVNESADLFFHTFVALRHLDIPLKDVFEVLHNRLNISGHAEKASRTKS